MSRVDWVSSTPDDLALLTRALDSPVQLLREVMILADIVNAPGLQHRAHSDRYHP